MKELPQSSCPLGFSVDDLHKILGDRFDNFMYWMRGQTMAICEGTRYHYNRKHEKSCMEPDEYRMREFGFKPHKIGDPFEWQCGYDEGGYYEPSECAENPHGVVVYHSDLNRYLRGLPIID